MFVKTLITASMTALIVTVASPAADAAGRSPVLMQSGITAEKRIVSSDGQVVGTMQTSPILIGDKVRFFVRSRGGQTFGRYSKDVIIDVDLDRLTVQGNTVVLPETEQKIFNRAQVPAVDDDHETIRVFL